MDMPVVDLTPRFGGACAFAQTVHARQRRKMSGVPYLAHLLAVAATVLDHGGDEDTAIAALLHDAPEDQGGRAMLAEIRRHWGPRVADIVRTVSDTFDDPKPDWAPRKRAYVAQVAAGSREAKLVCAADKLHNLRCTLADVRAAGPGAMRKFSASPRAVVGYYDACLAAVRADVPFALVAELDATLAALRAALGLARPARPASSSVH